MTTCRVILFTALTLAGCTKRNEAKFCAEGTCTTPDFPFCDVTGAIGGEAGTCIAVTCEPGAFGECRGDFEVRCNASGNNYDVVQCERGCEPGADGCRLCNPNETACTNGKVATCDANGTVVSTTECILGCFEDQPRCRDIAPANGLAQFLDMFPNAPAVNLVNAVFNTETGEVSDNGVAVVIPNVLVPAPPDGAPIRVFVVGSAIIQTAIARTKIEPALEGPTDRPSVIGPALAIVSHGDVQITGPLLLTGNAGGVVIAGCAGGLGNVHDNCAFVASGGGGGGHATEGGRGGNVAPSTAGGVKGNASGSERLIPLRGGCPGGGANDETGVWFEFGGPGGGALQVSSRTRVEVNGVIDARGRYGGNVNWDEFTSVGFAGGAGGAVLLEAPSVELGPNAKLLATGGNGSGCLVSTANCGYGGNGAMPGIAATAGEDVTCTGGSKSYGGPGGGGLGRVRVNTASGTYVKSNTAVEAAEISSGMIDTR